MDWFQIIGIVATYVVGTFFAGYAGFFVTYGIQAIFRMNDSLAAIAAPAFVAIVIWILGAVGGLMLFGALIAQ